MAGNMTDPLTFLAAVAARTSTSAVGTGIFQLPIHNPVRVAEQVATIDQISGGRISLGVGLGWWPLEYEVHGSDIRQRGARMEEALEILRLVWSQEDTAFEGRFWSFPELTVHPRPVQQPEPAAVGRRGGPRRGRPRRPPGRRLAVGPGAVAVGRPALPRRLPAGVRGASASPPTSSCGATRGSAPTTSRCAPRCSPTTSTASWSTGGSRSRRTRRRRSSPASTPARTVSPEEIAADRLLWGGPERMIGQIEAYRASTGAEHVHAAFGAGLPADTGQASLGEFDEIAAMIRLFGREVIPAFERGLTDAPYPARRAGRLTPCSAPAADASPPSPRPSWSPSPPSWC